MPPERYRLTQRRAIPINYCTVSAVARRSDINRNLTYLAYFCRQQFFTSLNWERSWLQFLLSVRDIPLTCQQKIIEYLSLNSKFTYLKITGFNVETVEYKNISFTVWDVGGQVRTNRNRNYSLFLRVFIIIRLVMFNKSSDILPCRIKSALYGDITTRTHKDLFSLWIPMTEIVSMQVCSVSTS